MTLWVPVTKPVWRVGDPRPPWEVHKHPGSSGVVYLLDYNDGTFTRSSEASQYGNFSFPDGADDLSVSDMTWAGTNVARIYAADGSVLIEEARTNLLPDSEDLSAWAPSSGSLTGGETSPDGTADAYRIETGAGLLGVFEAGASKTSGDPVSFSLFNRLGTSEICRHGVARLGKGVQIDEAAAADWTRRSVSGTYGNTGAQNVLIAEGRAGQPITGNAASGATDQDVWGVHWEDAAFPSSYIRTSGTAATRAADVLYLTNANYDAAILTDGFEVDVWPLFSSSDGPSYQDVCKIASRTETLDISAALGRVRLRGNGQAYTHDGLTWSRYQKLTIRVEHTGGTGGVSKLTCTGFTTGDGSTEGPAATTWTTPGNNLYVGQGVAFGNYRISRFRQL